MTRSHRVAVVGMGCRFPGGADTPERFWSLLESGRDPVGPLPPGRFDVEQFLDPVPGTPGRIVTADGGFLPDIDRFDAAFFGLSPREARKIDPQHRLLLEVAWEALEDAGIPPSSLAGRRVGVYVGVWSGEYENVMYRTPGELDFHSITGGGRYAASGRISYALDLRGPALTVDTGCSASLVALDLAHRAVESGDVDLAIVGAANLVLQPQVNIGYSRSGMLSAGARCRFGDADAAGYVRSDGAAAVVLRPLATARASGDRVRGVLLATGVNADGQGSGQLATPSTDAQADLLELVYARAGVEAGQVGYVEAHGTGTRAGDPVELQALGRVLGKGRGEDSPLRVGSVKTVIGHTEAAAGLAGLIKTLLVLEHRRIPANLHLRTPSDAIPWEDLNVEIPTTAADWPRDVPLVAGVSSFGITGTNAHVVVSADPMHGGGRVEERPTAGEGAGGRDMGAGELQPSATQRKAPDDTAAVVVLSGKTPAALTGAAEALRTWLQTEGGKVRLPDLAYTTTCRREHHAHRLAIPSDSIATLMAGLDDHLSAEAGGRSVAGKIGASSPRVGFIFSGQGSQWVGMARELMKTGSVFGEWIRRCDGVLTPLTGWALLEVLESEDAGVLEPVDVVQPTLTCVQIALSEQLRAWGIEPRAVAGHSMGEVAAAFCAGALSLEDALRVVAVRSRLLAGIAGRGAMALVDLPEEEVEPLIRGMEDRVSVAAVNGPRSTVLSGDPETIDGLLADLETRGVFNRRVRVDVASHSAQTDPLLTALATELSGLEPVPPRIPFHSTPRPDPPRDQLLDAGYWVDNLRRPVRLMSAVREMIEEGIDTFVEIAPHPVLLSSLADIAADAGASITTLAGPRRGESEMNRTLELLARLHVLGAPVSWSALAAPEARLVHPPTYPWQRERHWIENWEEWSAGGKQGGVPTARPEATDRVSYVVGWEPHTFDADGEARGRWLIVGEGPVAEALRRRIVVAGGDPVVLPDAEAAGREATRSGAPLAGVIHFQGVGVRLASGAGVAEFEQALEQVYGAALRTVDALRDASARPERGTLLVTAGVQGVGGRMASLASVPQGSVWGMVRTLAPEHPELGLRVVDIAPIGDPEEAAGHIWSAALDSSEENQLAVGQAGSFAARLERTTPDDLARPVRWGADCSYLVTGGFGDLGLAVAEGMVEGGARRIILNGRTAPPERVSWAGLPVDHPFAKQVALIRSLERKGASIHLAPFDVSDEGQLGDFLARYRAEGWPPIRGVVHCAGTLTSRDGSWEAFRTLAAGKALGAHNLHRALPDLDVMVLFSSIASVLPQYNAHYAAANAVLDTLAAARRSVGLPAVSLSWGAWEGEGLARDPEVARTIRILESQGIRGFSREEAVALFPWGAGAMCAHVMLADVDWGRARDRMSGRPGARFYPELADGPGGTSGAGRSCILELPAAARPKAMMERLGEIAGRILQLPSAAISRGVPLGRQGLDSLMALEFRNRLEIEFELRLPASLAWNYPTLDLLSTHLLLQLDSATGQGMEHAGAKADARVPAGSDAEDVVRRLEDGDEDVHAAIAELAGQSEEDILRQLRGGAG